MKEKQHLLWEEKLPKWLTILDRLDEINISEADSSFIKDIENDYRSINIVDEAKKFVYYWSGKRKLKTNRRGSWKLGWKNWLEKTKSQIENHERPKSRPQEDKKRNEYFRSKEYLQEVIKRSKERQLKKQSKHH